MRPMAISGTPDGLGSTPSSTQTLLGVGFVAFVIWYLNKRR